MANITNSKIYRIEPDSAETTIGAGVIFKDKKFITHTLLDESKSAIITFAKWQKIFLFSLFFSLIIGLILFPLKTLGLIIAILSIIYFIDVIFNLYVIFKSLYFPPEIIVKDEEIKNLSDQELPTYSILCPLYKESEVIKQFLTNIDNIDWPKEKLDVLLLLEEDDSVTQEAAKNIDLPDYVRVIIVPSSLPKTKPKACNYGLQLATGRYLVIYDAEDLPDPLQLKKAYLSFTKVPRSVYCLQAKLNYYNSSQNLLTRLFTAEYSLWFDVVLPGLQSINTSIPLGGTSNHFRTSDLLELQGWDPFNVTEDCDLGVRLFKEGYKTAIFDSTTLEEANSEIKNWIRQRSRWIKGYLQTYFVHTRNPVSFIRDFKFHALIFQLIIGLRISFILINPLLWVTTIAYFAFYQYVGHTIEFLYPPLIFYMAAFALLFGNFIYLYNYMIGCAKKEQWSIIKFVYLVPFYWFLMTFGAVLAIYQLIFKPYFWEKTNHGLNVKKEKKVVLEPINSNLGTVLKEENKYKILIFNWYDTKHEWAGGAEIYIHKIAKYLLKNNCEVTIFSGNDGKSLNEEVIDGIRIIRKGSIFTVPIWAFIYYIFRLRGKYDLIIDSAKGVPFFTPLYANIPKIGIVFHIHQKMFDTGLPFPLKQIAMTLEAKLLPLIYQNVEMVTISNSSKTAMKNIGFDKRKIQIAIPGVKIKSTKINKTSCPTLVYLGRLRQYKHVDNLILALVEIKKYCPETKLIIAGTGEHEGCLRKLTRDLRLEKAVDFRGRVSESEKSVLLSKSWIAVQPSEIEGWGITNIEANRCGTPVVASNVDGLKDSVINGKTGILVPVNNVDCLAQAIIKIISDEDLRWNLTQNAIQWSKNFKWNKSGRVFLNLINQKLKKPVEDYKLSKNENWEGVYE